MTLADKIRQMSDADLAKFIKQITDCCNASGANGDDYGCKICPFRNANCTSVKGVQAELGKELRK